MKNRKILFIILAAIFLIIIIIIGYKLLVFYSNRNITCLWNSGVTEYYIGNNFSEATTWVGFDSYNACIFKHKYILHPIPHQTGGDNVSKKEFFSEIDKINKSCDNCVKKEWAGVN